MPSAGQGAAAARAAAATDADLPEFSVLRGSPAVAASWRIAASLQEQQDVAALAVAAPAPPARMGRRLCRSSKMLPPLPPPRVTPLPGAPGLRGLEASGAPSSEWWAGGLRHRAAPLVEGVLAEAEAAAAPFERVVALWPARAAELEAALAGALRAAAAAAARQCGLLAVREPGGGGGARVAWRSAPAPGGAPGAAAAFAGTPAALRRGLAPEHALLLNSLRGLLVAAPRLEAQLGRWPGAGAAPAVSAAGLAAGAAERLAAAAGQAAPELGAHWAQLARELRTTYSAPMTLCAEALAAVLAADPPSALAATLRREALATAPAALERRLCRALDASAPALRAFVARARGLWDLAAQRNVLRFAEDPSEGGGGAPGAWRARAGAAAALCALDAFYRAQLAQLAGALGANLGATWRRPRTRCAALRCSPMPLRSSVAAALR
jgi:hypothetical protein